VAKAQTVLSLVCQHTAEVVYRQEVFQNAHDARAEREFLLPLERCVQLGLGDPARLYQKASEQKRDGLYRALLEGFKGAWQARRRAVRLDGVS
jgi:hypothetical protein